MTYQVVVRTETGIVHRESAATLNDASNRCKAISTEGVLVPWTSAEILNGTHIYYPPYQIHYCYIVTNP